MGKLVAIKSISTNVCRGRKEPLDMRHVATLAKALEGGSKLPPVSLWDVPKRGILVEDGEHRIEAYRLAGETHVPANVRKGSWEDFVAALIKCGSRQKGELPLFESDREHRVLIAIFELPLWADARIAKAVGVSDKYVAKLRAIHGTASHSINNQGLPADPDVGQNKRQGADGKWYPATIHQAPSAPAPSYAGGYFVPPQAPRVKPDVKIHVPGLPDIEGPLAALRTAIDGTAAALGAIEMPAHEQALRMLADLRLHLTGWRERQRAAV